MTESALQRDVQALCGELGLLWHHCRDSRSCDGTRGFPDLVIAGPGGVLVIELKSADGETSAGQDLWAWTLARAVDGGSVRMDYQLWRPADLASGLIRAELERIAMPRIDDPQHPQYSTPRWAGPDDWTVKRP